MDGVLLRAQSVMRVHRATFRLSAELCEISGDLGLVSAVRAPSPLPYLFSFRFVSTNFEPPENFEHSALYIVEAAQKAFTNRTKQRRFASLVVDCRLLNGSAEWEYYLCPGDRCLRKIRR
jgi:hypothetical protein